MNSDIKAGGQRGTRLGRPWGRAQAQERGWSRSPSLFIALFTSPISYRPTGIGDRGACPARRADLPAEASAISS
jgi:hypothetical protein